MFMSLLLNVLGGLIAGLSAAYIFWHYLRFLKPKIEISSELTKRPHPHQPNLLEYKFRIRNKSKNRSVIDIRANVDLVKVSSGKLRRGLGLTLTHTEVFMLEPFNKSENLGVHSFTIDIYSLNLEKLAGFGFSEHKRKELQHKVKHKTIQLEDLMAEFTFLRVNILATDPSSGMTHFCEKRYTLNAIKESYDFVGVELEPIPLHQKQELYKRLQMLNDDGEQKDYKDKAKSKR